ncbi:MAG TPA: DMT family protein [Ignavibacteria bacterium]|nr:DMT family protein [Ignavibacteria bacterium]
MTPYITIGMLVLSNVFMNFAWYGHLKNRNSPLLYAILISWGIALFEYMLTVPANRLGYGVFSLFQLKIMQEIITIVVFISIAVLYFGEKLKWNYAVGFVCIVLAAFFVFYKWD